MNAPITREKYEISLGKFLDFIGIDVEDGNRSFVYTMASSGIFSNIAIKKIFNPIQHIYRGVTVYKKYDLEKVRLTCASSMS
jgi:hypothetical protein